MSECTHDCSSCSENCSDRDPKSFIEKPNKLSSVKKIIGVVSGKGGVGKSTVTSLLAVEMSRKGFKSGILDADITGPSVPKMFGLTGVRCQGSDDGLFPALTKTGIPVMSINLLLEDETDPVVWRGPVIAGAVKQFWTDVIWEDVDFLFVDMPPGTGDVPLTVFQSIPVDGIVIVTSPQDLVSLIVGKAVKMAKMMNIPVLGLVENMSYFECPECKSRYEIYGESKLDKTAAEWGIPPLAKLPVNPALSKLSDSGEIEQFDGDWLDFAAEKLKEIL